MGNILVVDDDEGVRETVRMALEDEGHTVVEADDGGEGLRLLQTSRTAMVVLFDLIMPRVDGATFLEGVLADPALARRHAFICFTASPNRLAPALDGLPNDVPVVVLSKPFEVDGLYDVVEQALDRLAGVAAPRSSAFSGESQA